MNVTFRLETPNDYQEVENLTREAFWNVYEPGCVEHYLLNRIRQSQDFIPELDFIAEYNGKIVGNIVCVQSYIEGDDNNKLPVLCCGPISVLPAYQHKGIGRKMIEHTLTTAERLGHKAILLCGDPQLYIRYGFVEAKKYNIRTADNRFSPALQIFPLNGTDLVKYSGRYFENNIYDIDTLQAEIFDQKFPTKEKIADTPTQIRFKEILTMQESFNHD